MRENFSTRVVPMRHAVHRGKPTEWQVFAESLAAAAEIA